MAPRYQSNVYHLPHRPAASSSPSTDGLSQTSPAAQLSGTKRSRSGRPIASTPSPSPIRRNGIPRHRCKDSFSSTGTVATPSTSSDSDSDWSASSEEEYILPPTHEFQAVRPDLQLFSYTCAHKWKAQANYGPPPEDRLPPRKRARTTGRQPRSACIKQDEDPNDSQLVVISHHDGYFHLACPFYVFNRTKYRRCLLQHDLQSIEAVIDHLCSHHMEPPCCAMCFRVFDKARDRDEHMSKRTCEFRDPVEIDGLDLYQKEKLSGRDRVHLGEKKRWYRIWKTVFPGTAPPHSPYLDRGIGLEMSMVRDYWTTNGRDCVWQYLTKRGLLRHHRQDEGRALAALGKLALLDLLTRSLKEHDV
ncbi:hypothetical protein B0T10DRAFT_493232 [Thelonectria olida]|uniref:C2H2-type domain-containing protein n=1 Tax=Thelonectria olida TaxID=1576542 RepID=A0A9P8VZ54_9HYPO|nr:hypothetical protein B0T10DRAFT_493232 [Thelonectria olida]